mmetsp:Transcript_12795/g.39300  ORF Transcript_12795/g.39300 Transcript_12795/m.39300 type:complete len:155 (-) Transcript_12795:246-710(-)
MEGTAFVASVSRASSSRQSVVCTSTSQGRENHIRRFACAAAAAATVAALAISPGLATPTDRCDNGVGPGCEQLSEGNKYILELQRKTAEKREQRAREALENYWQKGYSDYFKAGYNKDLVRKEDGTWELRAIETPESKAIKALFGKKEPNKPQE